MDACVYVTRGWGVHDVRWIEALRAEGIEPTQYSVADNVEDLNEIVVTILDLTPRPILAGPLTPVAKALAQVSPHVVGLSWGFDLFDSSDLTWLPSLAHLIVDSQATQRIALDAGMPTERITMLPWGVDLSTFDPVGPTPGPRSWDLSPDSRILLSLRAHEPLYRIADVIEAFTSLHARHPDLALVIGHSGSLTPDVHAQSQRNGMEPYVRFIDPVEEGELPPILRSASVYVSASEVDGSSVTLLQAMACETPVVVSDNAGNRDWIDERTGYTFPVGSIESLVQAVDQVLGDPQEAALRAARARATVCAEADWQANRARLGHAVRAAQP